MRLFGSLRLIVSLSVVKDSCSRQKQCSPAHQTVTFLLHFLSRTLRCYIGIIGGQHQHYEWPFPIHKINNYFNEFFYIKISHRFLTKVHSSSQSSITNRFSRCYTAALCNQSIFISLYEWLCGIYSIVILQMSEIIHLSFSDLTYCIRQTICTLLACIANCY